MTRRYTRVSQATPKQAHWLYRLNCTLGHTPSDKEAMIYLTYTQEVITNKINDAQNEVMRKGIANLAPMNKTLMDRMFRARHEW